MAEDSKIIGVIGVDEQGDASVKEPVYISLSSFKSKKFIDFRKFFLNGNEWKPSKKGITFNEEQLDELIKILKNNDSQIKNFFNGM